MRFLLSAALILSTITAASAWDGTDNNGNTIKIEKGQTVRPGREIEYYDHGSGSYRTLDVDSMRSYGRSVEIEGSDENGNSVTLDMD